MTTRVLEYGCTSEHYGGYDNVPLAIDIMRRSDLLWNALVDIERYNLTEFRRLTTDLTLEASLKEKDDAIEALNARIQQQKVQERKKHIQVDPIISQTIRLLKNQRQPIYEVLRLARLQLKETNAPALETLRQDIKCRYDAALKEPSNHLNYSIRNPLLKAFQRTLVTGRKRVAAIVERKIKAGRKVNGSEGLPRPRRSDGTGIVTVPFTNGLAVSKAQIWRDGVGKLQIGAPDPDYEVKTQNRAKNQRQFENHRRELRLCRLAIATDPKRKPIWLTLPVIFHRPIPELAEIRSVTARRNLIAGKAHWKLCITIRAEKPANSTTPLASAVTVGWRKREDGHIRVAYLVDENGHQEELLFPASDMAQYRELDELQGIMSSQFNETRDSLAAWFRSVIPRGRENGDSVRIPRAVLEACSTDGTLSLHQWKSASRLVRLMSIWKTNRFQGDQQPWDALIQWYHGDPTAKTQHQAWKGHLSWSQARRSSAPKPDLWNGHRHLYLWWRHLSDQLHRRRRERYRVFAAGLARRYGTIFTDDFDLRSVIETPSPEWDKVHDRLARFQRTKVAPGFLREAIKNVCLRERINMIAIDAKGITHTCPKCGVFMDFDAARNIMCMCEDCGGRFDQDYVAAKNILNRGIDRSTWGARVIVAT